jgi:branched-chain amino acid transport system substrate-binding protein
MSEGFHIFNTFSFHPRHDPQHISQLLLNALKKVKPVDGREHLNLQWVKFIDVDEYGLKFAIAFDCLDRMMKNSQQNVVMLEIHKTLQHAGISMSAGRLSTILEEDVGFHALKSNNRIPEHFEPEFYGEFNPYNETIKNKVLLQKVPIFMSMSNEELELISKNCSRVRFNNGDVIIKQNDPGDSLFIIADGVVSVQVEQSSGERQTVSKLGVGDFFGEMSLMTGEPRTADVIAESPTVALDVQKSVIKEIFIKNPKVSDMISDVLAKRKIALEQVKLKSRDQTKETRSIALEIKNAIVKFLS